MKSFKHALIDTWNCLGDCLFPNKQTVCRVLGDPLLQNILENVPVRVFWKDIDGRYLGANRLFLNDAELTDMAQIIGKTDFDMPWAREQGRRYHFDDLEVIFTGQPKLVREDVSFNEAGEMRVWLTSKVPLRDPRGDIIGMLGTYEDITAKNDRPQSVSNLN